VERQRSLSQRALDLAHQVSYHTANGARGTSVALFEAVAKAAMGIHDIVSEFHKRGLVERLGEYVGYHVVRLDEVGRENK
jgi:hypothetical protein